ncbi:DNA repair exonuclease [Candidatus Woesearchaeota archaeon]|nr:DNA repair exonuclease [Candidatus Woesearchaeota archaeon]
MRFAHIADCHIGGWRDPKLRDAGAKAFERAIGISIERNVDFVLIAGDLFNTSLPSVDGLKAVVRKLKELKDNGIPAYLIAGSHDFSPSGKTMLDVLEDAGLFVNAAKGEEKEGKLKLKFTIDRKTGAKITGMIGKKGGLEKSYYEALLREDLEKEEGYKIFMFHSLLSELKTKELEKADSQPVSLLPKNFDYYAGGHPHIVKGEKIEGYGTIAYPGPLFPNNFREIEELGNGGFYIVEDSKISFEPVMIYNTFRISIDAEHKSPDQAREEIMDKIKGREFNDTIVTIRAFGVLESGKPSDIGFKEIFDRLYEKSAYFVMKNTSKLLTKEFKEIKIDASDADDAEDRMIREHIGQVKIDVDEVKATKELMRILSVSRDEGEKVADFERRIKGDVEGILFGGKKA